MASPQAPKTPTREGATPAATKPAAATTTAKETKTVDTGIDLSKLTPEQLAALQKQLKAKKKETSGRKDERFAIIDTMLQEKVVKGEEKDGQKAGEFKHTTRDILNKLVENDLVDKTVDKYDQVEIKKIQARKQFLEKKTDEKGKLVSPENTFGYRPSAGAGFSLTPVRISEWFTDAERVKSLTAEQRSKILTALK